MLKIESRLASRSADLRLLSTIHGAIDNLLFSVPSWIFDRDWYRLPERRFIDGYLAVVRGIIRAAGKSTAFTLLTHRGTRDKLGQWLSVNRLNERAAIVAVPDAVRFTVWSNDMFLTLADRNGRPTRCVAPRQFPRAEDGAVAKLLARSAHYSFERAPVFFQGGNVLVGDRFILLGADDALQSIRKGWIEIRSRDDETTATSRAVRSCIDATREVVLIGSRATVHQQHIRPMARRRAWNESLYFGNMPGSRQPLFHIDMFISLMGRQPDGRYKLLVADPSMAASLLGGVDWPDPMQEAFDDIARQLVQDGFAVERNPLPLAFLDNRDKRTRVWYFATSNNVLVQDDPPIAWMPSYGHGRWKALARTDAVNREIWERSGYEVRMLPNCHALAAWHGGPNCISKCMGRAVSTTVSSFHVDSIDRPTRKRN